MTRVEYFGNIGSWLIAECFAFIFHYNLTAADMKKFRVSAYRRITTVLKLNLLKLTESQILSSVYQWSHRLSPPCFSAYFKFTSSVHSYSTRQSCNRNLYVASFNTT